MTAMDLARNKLAKVRMQYPLVGGLRSLNSFLKSKAFIKPNYFAVVFLLKRA